MKEKSPQLDIQNQLLVNTSIFKENLKVIVTALVESLWKEKTKTDKIQETIKLAYNEIYRGEFEEIKEVDEEQMYNSWMNSKSSIERIKTESGARSSKKQPNKDKTVRKDITDFEGAQDINPNILVSDIYDKDSSEKKNSDEVSIAEEELNELDLNNQPDKHVSITNSMDPTLSKWANNSKITTENLERMQKHRKKRLNNSVQYHNENSLKENNVTKVGGLEEHNNLLESDAVRSKVHLPYRYREFTKKHMRSFDKGADSNNSLYSKALQLDTGDLKGLNSKFTATMKDFRRSQLFMKEQYFTNTQNRIKRDRRANNSRTDLIDYRLKNSVKNSIKDNSLKLSVRKVKARNRSSASMRSQSHVEEVSTNRIDTSNSNLKELAKHKRELPLSKAEMYR